MQLGGLILPVGKAGSIDVDWAEVIHEDEIHFKYPLLGLAHRLHCFASLRLTVRYRHTYCECCE